MSDLQLVLAIVGGLFVLTCAAAGIWATFRSTDQDTRIKRLRDERDDLLSRLNYIEPKVSTLEEQNKLLLDLHNPAGQIEALRAQEAKNHSKTFDLLEKQHQVLMQIDRHLSGRGGS